jgi:beta-1,4-mannosyltransferase
VDQLYLRSTAAGSVLASAAVAATLVALRLAGKRLVWTAHNLRNHEGRFPAIDATMTRVVARVVHRVIAHCEAGAATIAATLGDAVAAKTVVVPHGDYLDVYPGDVSVENARAPLGTGGSPVILFFGNVRPYKGVEQLVRAFRAIEAPSARLIIAGQPRSADLAARLRTAAGDDGRITLTLGFIPHEDLPTFFAASDVVVLPYVDILMSSAAMMALSQGRACIAPRLGCLPALLDATCAFLYEPSDPAGLQRALQQGIDATPRLAAMGRAARARALAFPWRDAALQTRDVYAGASVVAHP